MHPDCRELLIEEARRRLHFTFPNFAGGFVEDYL